MNTVRQLKGLGGHIRFLARSVPSSFQVRRFLTPSFPSSNITPFHACLYSSRSNRLYMRQGALFQTSLRHGNRLQSAILHPSLRSFSSESRKEDGSNEKERTEESSESTASLIRNFLGPFRLLGYLAIFGGVYWVIENAVNPTQYLVQHVMGKMGRMIDIAYGEDAEYGPDATIDDVHTFVGEGYHAWWFTLVPIWMYFSDHFVNEFFNQNGTGMMVAMCEAREERKLDNSHMITVANILSHASNNDQARHALSNQPGIMKCTMAMSKSKNPELASHAFVALQGFLKNPKMKKQFIEDRGIQMLCKMFANRDIPAMEIFDAIQRLLVGFLYEFPDVQDFRLSRREMNELFQSVTQLGGQLTEMSQHQLAVNAYEAALQLDDSNPQLLMAAAVLQVGLDQLDDAADKFRRALERAPGTPIAAYNLAKILVKQHGHSRTAQLEAVELLEACLDSVRSGAPKREFTLPGFQPLKGRDNRRIKLTHPLTSPVFSLLVMMLERQGRYQEALKYAEEWSLWCLNEGRAQIALGRLLYKNGEHDRALDFFSKSMEMDPSNPVFAFMKSMTHFKHHQYEEALELVDTALILDQSQSQTYKRIMERTLAKQRKINKESRKAGVKPERLQLPDMPQSVHDSGLLLKGRILMRMNRTEDALVTLDQVCAQQQDSKETTDPDCTALMLAGNCLMKLNRSAEAEDRFKQAIQVWKAASEALFSSPRMYFMSHPSQDTLLQSLEEFVTAHPDSMSTVGTLLRTSGITSREE